MSAYPALPVVNCFQIAQHYLHRHDDDDDDDDDDDIDYDDDDEEEEEKDEDGDDSDDCTMIGLLCDKSRCNSISACAI